MLHMEDLDIVRAYYAVPMSEQLTETLRDVGKRFMIGLLIA